MKINKSVIFTALGCIGVGATASLAIKNTRDYDKKDEPVSKAETAKIYLPTIACGIATCGCIVASNIVSAKELAAAVTAVGVASAKYRDLCDKIRDKHPQVYDEIQKDAIQRRASEKFAKKPVTNNDGSKLYYESFSESLFWATEAEALEAECELNKALFNTGEYTLYDYLANFKDVELKNWMKFVGWFEGDTSYSYNAGYLGSYVKPVIEQQTITVDGHTFNANAVLFSIVPDINPECNPEESECIISAIDTGVDV